MKNPLTDEDLQERTAIDGRVVFAMSAFVLLAGLVALLDRVGVPERLVSNLGPFFTLAGLAIIGVLLRSMRISRFYAGGRAVPAAYAGLASAALAAGLVLPFIPPAPDNLSGAGLFAGFAGGLAFVGLVTGPFLRKTGAFSVCDLIAARFPNLALRLGVAIVVAAIGALVAIAGFQIALETLTDFTGLGRAPAAGLLALIILLVAAPGGVSGIVWAGTGATGIIVAAFALPLATLLARGQSVPLPLIGDSGLWRDAAVRIAAWQGGAIAEPSLTLSIAMGIGLAALAPLLAPPITARDRGAALRSGLAMLGWSTVLAALFAATVAASALLVYRETSGQRADRLPPVIYAASAAGLIDICGGPVESPAAARIRCNILPGATVVLRPQDVRPDGMLLVTALPALAGFGAASTGLVSAAIVAAGLIMACAGILAFATALGHDAFYRVRDQAALTSRRLAITRILIAFAAIAGAVLLSVRTPDPRLLIGLAIALSAAGIAPLLALSLWPRALGADAVVALLAGLGVAEAIFLSAPPEIGRLAFGACAGCATGLLAGVGTSFLRRGDRAESKAFVEAVLRGEGDVLRPDKGA